MMYRIKQSINFMNLKEWLQTISIVFESVQILKSCLIDLDDTITGFITGIQVQMTEPAIQFR